MKLDRDTAWSMLFALAVAGMGAWIVMHTHWVTEELPDPPKGEARQDAHYAIKQIIHRLGGTTRSPDNLDQLPPVAATLVLSSWNWDLLPAREAALRQWVEAGGHLVTDQWKRPSWIGVDNKRIDDKATRAQREAPASAPLAGLRLPAAACQDVSESPSGPNALDGRRSYRLCVGGPDAYLKSTLPPVWTLEGANGPSVLRTAHGRGAATVVLASISENRNVFQADHALVFVAALDLAHRPEVWFVDTESRDPFLTLIWRHARPAVLLSIALLAFALWRAAVRFGPPARQAPLSRRSVAEQIRGTAAFIFRRDAAALHQAQLRALEEGARRNVRDHDRLDRRSRAEAIARIAALDADALARAMDTSLKRSRRDLLATLTLLETALRRLAPPR